MQEAMPDACGCPQFDLEGHEALFVSPTDVLSPLLHSQGIPHMRELAKRGLRFTLLSFERRDWNAEECARADRIRETLAKWGIQWEILRFGRLPFVPNSVSDIVRGAAYTWRLIRRKKIEVVHCRSHMPAFMVLFLRRLVPVKFLFDMRGFLPDEYVESGHWTRDRWEYRLAKRLEGRCLRAADSVVVTSEGMRRMVRGFLADGNIEPETVMPKVTVIPNLADTDRFRPDAAIRARMRQRYGLDDHVVFLWLVGGVTKAHLLPEVVLFFHAAKKILPQARLLVVTATCNVAAQLEENGLSDGDYLVLYAPPEDVPAYVLMGDVGINFAVLGHPGSAVKLAEYLSCGMPLLVSATNENLESLVDRERTGVVVGSFDEAEYRRAAERLASLLAEGEALKRRCRFVAEERLSLRLAVEKYAAIYRTLLTSSPSRVQKELAR
jgi:glycosyltransferase involved in cell wall biosynthesis